jgi:hypothetical protein
MRAQCSRLHARLWSKEELAMLEGALKDVMQRTGDGFTLKEVVKKFCKHTQFAPVRLSCDRQRHHPSHLP